MTPLEAAVYLQAAYIKDGSPGDIAAKKAWEAVRDLWEKRPVEWESSSQLSATPIGRDPSAYWHDLAALPRQTPG